MEGRLARQKAFEDGIVTRFLLPEILELASKEGIIQRIMNLSPFSFDDFCTALQKDLGYVIPMGNRRRMIAVFLDILNELGLCVREEGMWRWVSRGGRNPAITEVIVGSHESGVPVDDGQLFFFRECLRHLPAYLRGGPESIGFDEKSVTAWDRFLGCAEFRSCRKLLLELMEVENRKTFRLLDLCHGPGWGIAEAVSLYPEVRLTAIDFTDAFSQAARGRVRKAAGMNREASHEDSGIRWIGPRQWSGFGCPLPFGDGEFDAVLFSGGDPYIPRTLRKAVYEEVARVLAPGGSLGILTRGYPDPGRQYVPSYQMRITALVHDFSESVCEGWEGFSDPEENVRMFKDIGFLEGGAVSGGMSFLESSLWVLRKGAAPVPGNGTISPSR